MTVYRRLAMGMKKILNPGPAEPPFGHICQVGDPILRQPCIPIPLEDLTENHMQMITQQMKLVMKSYNVLGLSACQIGVPLRIIALNFCKTKLAEDLDPDCQKPKQLEKDPILVLQNPVMTVTDYTKVSLAESCASVKGYSGVVSRFSAVSVTGYCREGKSCTVAGRGLLSRLLQHEMDHLNGKLFLDSMDVSTFQNDGWQRINSFAGHVNINFLPDK